MMTMLCARRAAQRIDVPAAPADGAFECCGRFRRNALVKRRDEFYPKKHQAIKYMSSSIVKMLETTSLTLPRRFF